MDVNPQISSTETSVSGGLLAETRPNTGTEVSREIQPIQQTAPSQSYSQASDAVTITPASNDDQSTTAITDDNPALAEDVDVIEKEWVEKAKKIVQATKEDPHQQEKEVSKLQADYLMKRYGKKVKTTE
jgi:hypothetical protein